MIEWKGKVKKLKGEEQLLLLVPCPSTAVVNPLHPTATMDINQLRDMKSQVLVYHMSPGNNRRMWC